MKPEDNVMIGLPDTMAGEDLLGLEDYTKACADFVIQCETPMSVAIQGGWGTGKSSFMNMMKKELLKKKEGIIPVVLEFNTWQYSRAGDERLFLPLLNKMLSKINETCAGDSDYEKYFKDHNPLGDIKKWFSQTIQGAGSALGGVNGSFAVVLGRMFEIGDHAAGGGSYYLEAEKAREGLQERIDYLCGRKKVEDKKLVETGKVSKRLIVFVDDLDRLRPGDAMNLLEDLKNFMDCRETVFVLALDQDLVQRGVKEKYGDTLEERYAAKFFEKIVQIPFYLPTGKYDIRKYITSLTETAGIRNLDPDDCVNAVEVFTDGNPRIIKRALNLYQMNDLIRRDSSFSGTGSARFALILMQMCHEDWYTAMAAAIKKISAQAPATVLFEDRYYKQVLQAVKEKSGRNEAAELLERLFPHYSQLEYEVNRNVFHAQDSRASREQRLDEIAQLLCSYLKEKGFKQNGDNLWEKEGISFEVKRFEKNAKIANFNCIDYPDAEKQLEELCKEGIVKPADEQDQCFFRGLEDTYIRKAHRLYIHNVVSDPRVLSVIGRLICRRLQEGNTKK